jgi:hypothetical protein
MGELELMAIATHKGLPIGPWRNDVKTDHWLVYKTFISYDDASGNDLIQLRQHIRAVLQQVVAELQEHKIEIVNAQTGEMYDHRSFERVYKLAIGFGCKEDLVMAKLVLNLDDLE